MNRRASNVLGLKTPVERQEDHRPHSVEEQVQDAEIQVQALSTGAKCECFTWVASGKDNQYTGVSHSTKDDGHQWLPCRSAYNQRLHKLLIQSVWLDADSPKMGGDMHKNGTGSCRKVKSYKRNL